MKEELPYVGEKKNKLTLNNLVNKFVDNRSILHTDCRKGYSKVHLYVKKHLTVNHSLGFIDANTLVHTNTIEGNWTAIKNSIPKRCRSKKYLSLWLHFFMFKRNNNTDPLLRFIKLLN